MLPLCYLALVFASHELVADVVECLVVHVQSIPKRKQRLHCASYPNVCLFYAIQRSNDSTKKRMQTLSHMCYLNRHETNLNTYLYLMLVAPMTVVTSPCTWHVYSVGHLSLSFGS